LTGGTGVDFEKRMTWSKNNSDKNGSFGLDDNEKKVVVKKSDWRMKRSTAAGVLKTRDLRQKKG